MPISPGTRLGPYEIVAAIGAGGMGEVYKARDTRLDRTVAIKVLPEHVAADPDLKQRFEREAKTISSLNHPHICTLYDIGSQDGIDFLVMEYLEGDTLAQRLEQGALPLDQALQGAIEIADALDKAHRQGITHRDLKPGNIMLTKAGAKLLDFGLAKLKPAGIGTDSALPTMSAGLTAEGAILGTLQYMAPEQLEGSDVDARTDIFAFGTTVYEMVTGSKAFTGKSQASLIGSILKDEPSPLTELQPVSPPALDRVVKKCLAKDPEARWHSAHDLHDELQWVAVEKEQVAVSASAPASGARRGRAAMVLAALAVGGGVVGLGVWNAMRSDAQEPVRFGIHLPDDVELSARGGVVLSPDGRTVVYAATRDGIEQLYKRDLSDLHAAPIPETENGRLLVFSPDGQWVGFSASGSFKRVPLEGGQAVTVSEGEGGFFPTTASWGTDGTIVFGVSGVGTDLYQVEASGGVPYEITRRLTEAGEYDHGDPEVLPGGDALLFAVAYATGRASEIVVQLRETGEHRTLIEGTAARYAPTGHIIFTRTGSLWAAPFDVDRLEITGPAVSMVDNVSSGQYAISDTGTLVYAPQGVIGGRLLVWVDRDGTEELVDAEPRLHNMVRVSPDGTQLLSAVTENNNTDIWLYDLVGDRSRPLTFDIGVDSYPIWAPDGLGVVFSSAREGIRNLFRLAADGTGQVDRLTDSAGNQSPWSWSQDGRVLLFQEGRGPEWNIHALSMDSGQSTVLLESSVAAQVSPDGKWIAYVPFSLGDFDVWLRPFPNVDDGQWQISRGGGLSPRWSPDGRELYYRQSPQGLMMAVAINADPIPDPGSPQPLFEDTYYYGEASRTYHISPIDGRFLMLKDAETPEDAVATADLVVVLNWFDELQRLVPSP